MNNGCHYPLRRPGAAIYMPTGRIYRPHGFNAYTVVENGTNDIEVVSATKLTASLTRNQGVSYAYIDKGVNGISPGFTHEFEFIGNSGGAALMFPWCISTNLAGVYDMAVNTYERMYLRYRGDTVRMQLYEFVDGASSNQETGAGVLSVGTRYYIRVNWNDSTGVVTCNIFSGGFDITTVSTLTVTVSTSGNDMQYHYAANHYEDAANSANRSFEVYNYNLDA